MPTLTNNFEAGSNGTTITTGNAGGNSNTQFDAVSFGAGSATFSSTTAAHGALSGKFSAAANTTVNVAWDTVFGVQTLVYGRANLYIPSFPAANIRFFQVIDGASVSWTCGVTTTGNLRSATGVGTTMSTSSAVIPLNQWVRVEFSIVLSATVSQSVINYYSDINATTPDETNTSTATYTTTATPDGYKFGLMASTSVTYTIYLDDIGLSSTGFLGPVPPTSPISWLGM